jgi:integrase
MPETMMRIGGGATKSLPKRVNFTVTSLAAVTCPPDRDRMYVYDARTTGLACMVTANGSRAFYFVRKLAGRMVRTRIGGREMTIEQARLAVARMNGDIALGNDPSAGKRAVRQSATLQELFDRWEAEHAKVRLAPRTQVTDKGRFDTCFEDWKNRRILSINESDVRAIHAKLGKERGHVTANRAVQVLRKLYNFARVGHNPASKATKMFPERSRERFILPAEMPALFKAIDDDQTNPLIRDFLYLCLFTGARRSNVEAMRDEEIDFERGVWTIPAEKTKAHLPIHVPLVPQALEIINRRKGHASGFILPGYGVTGHLVEAKATWKDVLTRAGLKDLRIHDLRRSLGSYQAALGSSLPVIGASLGHSNLAATAIYSRLHLEPVRQSVLGAANAISAAAKAVPRTQKTQLAGDVK